MDSIKFEALLAAVDQGSLTAAAASLGYTQPGITRMIRSLEDEIGFLLLARSNKGVALTENGREMLPLFREIVRAHKNAEEVGSAIKGILRGVLVIGSYFSVSSILLPQIFQHFAHNYPEIKIKLREGDNLELREWLTEKSVDCCFAAQPYAGTVCDWIPVLEDELVVWLPPGHPRAKDACFPVEALKDEPFIMTRPNQDTDIDRLLAKYGISPRIHLTTSDAFTTYCMVEAGMGISLNQRLIFQKWAGNIVALPFCPRQTIALGIAVPDLREASPATKKFVEYVKDCCRKKVGK